MRSGRAGGIRWLLKMSRKMTVLSFAHPKCHFGVTTAQIAPRARSYPQALGCCSGPDQPWQNAGRAARGWSAAIGTRARDDLRGPVAQPHTRQHAGQRGTPASAARLCEGRRQSFRSDGLEHRQRRVRGLPAQRRCSPGQGKRAAGASRSASKLARCHRRGQPSSSNAGSGNPEARRLRAIPAIA